LDTSSGKNKTTSDVPAIERRTKEGGVAGVSLPRRAEKKEEIKQKTKQKGNTIKRQNEDTNIGVSRVLRFDFVEDFRQWKRV
jgi:hypothetical protein